jgi:hypothetical protein
MPSRPSPNWSSKTSTHNRAPESRQRCPQPAPADHGSGPRRRRRRIRSESGGYLEPVSSKRCSHRATSGRSETPDVLADGWPPTAHTQLSKSPPRANVNCLHFIPTAHRCRPTIAETRRSATGRVAGVSPAKKLPIVLLVMPPTLGSPATTRRAEHAQTSAEQESGSTRIGAPVRLLTCIRPIGLT